MGYTSNGRHLEIPFLDPALLLEVFKAKAAEKLWNTEGLDPYA